MPRRSSPVLAHSYLCARHAVGDADMECTPVCTQVQVITQGKEAESVSDLTGSVVIMSYTIASKLEKVLMEKG